MSSILGGCLILVLKKTLFPVLLMKPGLMLKSLESTVVNVRSFVVKVHAFMPIVVNVLEKEEYNTWLSEKKVEVAAIRELAKKTFTLDELMVKGEEAYNRQCASCHMANGEGIPGVFPALKGSAVAVGDVSKTLGCGCEWCCWYSYASIWWRYLRSGSGSHHYL